MSRPQASSAAGKVHEEDREGKALAVVLALQLIAGVEIAFGLLGMVASFEEGEALLGFVVLATSMVFGALMFAAGHLVADTHDMKRSLEVLVLQSASRPPAPPPPVGR